MMNFVNEGADIFVQVDRQGVKEEGRDKHLGKAGSLST